MHTQADLVRSLNALNYGTDTKETLAADKDLSLRWSTLQDKSDMVTFPDGSFLVFTADGILIDTERKLDETLLDAMGQPVLDWLKVTPTAELPQGLREALLRALADDPFLKFLWNLTMEEKV